MERVSAPGSINVKKNILATNDKARKGDYVMYGNLGSNNNKDLLGQIDKL